jgi:hypothetical protein
MPAAVTAATPAHPSRHHFTALQIRSNDGIFLSDRDTPGAPDASERFVMPHAPKIVSFAYFSDACVEPD